MVKKLVEVAEREGAKYIAHGCTGKETIRSGSTWESFPESEPQSHSSMRECPVTREQEIEYAKEHGIEIIVKRKVPTRGTKISGALRECGALEDPWAEPPAGVWVKTTDPEKAPNVPEYIEIEFQRNPRSS